MAPLVHTYLGSCYQKQLLLVRFNMCILKGWPGFLSVLMPLDANVHKRCECGSAARGPVLWSSVTVCSVCLF